MTNTLAAAIAKLAVLSPDEQDRIGRWLLYELGDGEQELLVKFASSRVTDLDPDPL